jgi:hypothetical protein
MIIVLSPVPIPELALLASYTYVQPSDSLAEGTLTASDPQTRATPSTS